MSGTARRRRPGPQAAAPPGERTGAGGWGWSWARALAWGGRLVALRRSAAAPLLAFQLVQLCCLVAVLCKISFYADYFRLYYEWPLDQDFFPAAFRSAVGLIAAYWLLVGALALSACQVQPAVRGGCVWIAFFSASYLLVHQGVYNDVTFTTLWWAQLWAVWYQSRLERGDRRLLARGAWLGRLIICVHLLGGAVGKWTPEYWSGQVFWEIFYFDRDYWFFNWQRRWWDAERLRQVATGYSRLVIVAESVGGLTLWLLPSRAGSWVAIVLLTTIAMLSNFYLFSVVLSLIGLAIVGLFPPAICPALPARRSATIEPD